MSGGRGAYYKAKYGGRGRGRDRDRDDNSHHRQRDDRDGDRDRNRGASVGSSQELSDILRRIDGRQYPCYKDLLGAWNYDNKFTLFVDHVQGDAYASPSKFRVQVKHSVSRIPPRYFGNKTCEVATRDFFARRFAEAVSQAGGDVRQGSGGWHGAKGGDMTVDKPSQQILERSAVMLNEEYIEARFTIGLPAQGRSVMGKMAHKSLIDMLPLYVHKALVFTSIDSKALDDHVQCVEDAEYARDQLSSLGLIAFVANHSILPRSSGASDTPMRGSEAVKFMSPPSLEVQLSLPHRGTVKGMGIARGVTLITGGGFHGKSTLLNAIEHGVYNHIPGDGREMVVAVKDAVKIRAEDGRYVMGVDISPFINNLPYDKSTTEFSSRDASGSTSQAANIQEALESGSRTLILDEDTCATNFMIRDERMQLLVSNDREPIRPLISRVRSMASKGVSCILVIGGCGEFFDVADRVITMDNFLPLDVTTKAKEISAQFLTQEKQRVLEEQASWNFPDVTPRIVDSVLPRDMGKVAVRNKSLVQMGDLELDLSCVEQIADISQTRAIADALRLLQSHISKNGRTTVASLLDIYDSQISRMGLDALSPDRLVGNYALPRRYEIAAALNRLRSAMFRQ